MGDGRLTTRVGIVSWNTADLLDRCLSALPSALGGLDASVVVVDNGSADDSESVVKAHPFVNFRPNHANLGYAKAMNQALAGTSSEVLIALNPDTEPPPGSLETLAHRLMEQPDVGMIGPRLLNPDGSLQHSAYTFPSLHQAAAVSFLPSRLHSGWIGRRLWLEGHADHLTPTDVDWFIGAVHVIRAEALRGRPPYSERWFMYVEDLELCWRLHKGGWRLRLEADIEIPHVGRASTDQAWELTPPERWMPASYDWFAQAYGPARMRLWAAINAAGVALHGLGGGVAELLRRKQTRTGIRRQIRLLALHARAVWHPPRPDSLPPPDGVLPD